MPVADNDLFYADMPVFSAFGRLMEPSLYQPLPDGWSVGVADVVQSTKAIAEDRYKAVNMAGASVIAAVTNALDNRAFPFAFGGDGASFAVAPGDVHRASDALAETATWVREALDLSLRVAMVPIEVIRAQGFDVQVARYAPSSHVSYAMFSGGGLAWAEAAMKRGEFAVPPAPSGAHPDLTGLSCRFSEMPAERGVILSLMAVPGRARDAGAFRRLIEDVVALVERSPDAGRPVPASGPRLVWPPQGLRYEALARRGGPLLVRRLHVQARTFFVWLIFRFRLATGGFDPGIYLPQVVENSDFRKYDDGLRMVLDCDVRLVEALEGRLAAASRAGIVRYGLHRQGAAIMTCFTLTASQPDHFHFVDGASGGYASAALALKTSPV